MDKKETEPASDNKEVVRTRTYTFVEKHFADGTIGLTRTNDGFSLLELLGLMEITRQELMEIFKGAGPKVDIVKRQSIKD